MLKICHCLREICFSSLLDVYKDTFQHFSSPEGKFSAEQEFYHYLKDYFFMDPAAFYAVWEPQGRYVAALRIEPYKDGFLLEALETAPEERGKGYATQLVQLTLDHLSRIDAKIIYSHVDKKNNASVCVHEKCGFSVVSDSAVYVDGSFSSDSYTYMYEFQ